MRTAWEYLLVVWVYSTNFATKGPNESQTWDRAYWVYAPGPEEPEKLPADLDWAAFVNKLGAEGWELVAERLQQSVVMPQSLGWIDVGTPVKVVWTSKRPAQEAREATADS